MRIIKVSDFIDESRIKDLEATNKEDAINEMIELISSSDNIEDIKAFKKAILKRETLMSTGIGYGIAVPHAKIKQCQDFVIAIGRLSKPIEYESIDDQPVELIFMIGASDQQDKDYIRLLSRLVLRLKDKAVLKSLKKAKDSSELFKIITSTK